MPDVIREDAFIDTFILPAKRDRYKQLLANPRRRSEFLDRLNHNLDFIPALAQQIPGSQHFAEGVVRLLCKRGMETADTVYIISDSRELVISTSSSKLRPRNDHDLITSNNL